MTFLEPGARVALATTPTPTPNMPFDATAARRSTRLKPIENVRVNTTGIVREIGTYALGYPLQIVHCTSDRLDAVSAAGSRMGLKLR